MHLEDGHETPIHRELVVSGDGAWRDAVTTRRDFFKGLSGRGAGRLLGELTGGLAGMTGKAAAPAAPGSPDEAGRELARRIRERRQKSDGVTK
jgi:hypothetical protein